MSRFLRSSIAFLLTLLLLLPGRSDSCCAGQQRAITEYHVAQGNALSFAPPFAVSASDAASTSPALAALHGTVHVAWEESSRIYHRVLEDGQWSAVRRAAWGEQPALALDANGVAHLVFVNEFGGNFEVYHSRWVGSWTLPRNVSNTTGISSSPAVSVAPNGTVHVVWADNTPGYSVIYHAYWNGAYWINEPIPNAFGGAPTLAADDGWLHVAWQDRDVVEGPYEVYYCRLNDVGWSLPEDLSDSPDEASIIPSLAVGPGGWAHVAWQERSGGYYRIRYTQGAVGYWSMPEQISESALDAYLPCLATRDNNQLYVGWDNGLSAQYCSRHISESLWSPRREVRRDPMGVTDLNLAVDSLGRLHAVWAELTAANDWEVLYQELSYRALLPLNVKGRLG